MDASAFFQSKGTFLNATHLAAGDLEVTIKSVEIERIGKNQEQKLVIYFDELTRGLILNKTNFEALSESFGRETDDWRERCVTLYAVKTKYEEKEVDGVRIRVDPANHLPREQRSKPQPIELDDDVPF
jgi:hypothetical protein